MKQGKKVLYGSGNLAKKEAWQDSDLEKGEGCYITIKTSVAGRYFWVFEQAGRILAANFYSPADLINETNAIENAIRPYLNGAILMEKETKVLREARRQLEEYFAGKRKEFCLPVAIRGTMFQLEDWQALCTIPYGETRSYGQLAAQIGRPKGSRAVGMANHNNPISVIIPCHRVIGSGGTLVGYGGGLDVKQALLALEQGKVSRVHAGVKLHIG